MLVSRLTDGRLLCLSDGRAKVFDGSKWVLDPDLPLASITESKPLSDEKIADLTSKGLFSQLESQRILKHCTDKNLTKLEEAILLAVER